MSSFYLFLLSFLFIYRQNVNSVDFITKATDLSVALFFY